MIAFTLCSNNYLAQAKVLGDSFIEHHPESKFIIGLIDRLNDEIDYTEYNLFNIITVEEIGIETIDELILKYNITEFNTAVKPYYFKYLFSNYSVEKIIYIDPDIKVFSRFEEVESLLDTYNIILTPQSCCPIDDNDSPTDLHLLGSGVFNLGFIALSSFAKTQEFLSWWSDRLRKYAYGRPSQHMFYDQIWINLVPVFFNNYYILKHPGYNMAAWNMHERAITGIQEKIISINNNFVLRFFHFSGYKFSEPYKFCSYSSRFSFENRKLESTIFSSYYEDVMAAKYDLISIIKPVFSFATSSNLYQKKTLFQRIKTAISILIRG